jgi:Rrf2 family transcriptional regulator, repressor of oqxAB
MVDVRFPTALQIMLNLAYAVEQGLGPLSSAKLAEAVGGNPSLIRTLLVPLVKAGLVHSSMGKNGGVRLGKAANCITLDAIYNCVANGKQVWTMRGEIPHRCVVSSNIEGYFARLTAGANRAVRNTLATITLADSLKELHAAEKRSSGRKHLAP